LSKKAFNQPFPRGQYGVIYIDPPWHQEMYSDKGNLKSPIQHYPTMTDEELIAMRDDILFAAGPNCVLFMWGLWNKLDFMTRLAEIWGFKFCTGGSWAKITKHGKQSFGTGYVLRGCSEPFIICTIGNPKIKNRGTRNHLFTGDVPENLNDLEIFVNAKLRDHSQKPDEMIGLIEALFDGPYLEAFARTERPGWTVWGNETDKYFPPVDGKAATE
jgi:N6-adenosine-specific RNA methylase IME4